MHFSWANGNTTDSVSATRRAAFKERFFLNPMFSWNTCSLRDPHAGQDILLIGVKPA